MRANVRRALTAAQPKLRALVHFALKSDAGAQDSTKPDDVDQGAPHALVHLPEKRLILHCPNALILSGVAAAGP